MSILIPTTVKTNNLISHSNKHECLKMIKVLNHKWVHLLFLLFFCYTYFLNILYFSLKNVEKEQHSIIFSKKNDKDLGELYEIYLINESNRKNESKRIYLFKYIVDVFMISPKNTVFGIWYYL
jgi:hypothetical protein